jgi:hypothetical protein
MGSRLTQDKAKMDELMDILSARGLFFVDSKTIQSSVAAHEAAQAGVPYAERDVFLDHVESREFVDKALRHAEQLALRRGYAIAIGHPKSFTLDGLRAWIPTLAAKGIELVPVSRLLTTPKTIPVKDEIVPVSVPASAPETVPAASPEAAPTEMVPPPQESQTSKEEAVPVQSAPMMTTLPAPSVDMFPQQGQGQ